MRRLYLRIYLAVLASLVAFAVVSAVLWHSLGDAGPAGHALEVAGTLAQNVLAPAEAPEGEQRAALEKLAANLRADITLFAADRTPLAGVGQRLPAPNLGSGRGGWMRQWGSGAWAVRLPDGRWMVARLPHDPRHPGVPLFFTLALVALAVGVGAHPIVRRLTSRLERLQAGVESLGAGDLSARVKVEGRDEVARLAESFNRAAGRIEELVGAHKALLANASHELRTPLTRIRLAVELIPGVQDLHASVALSHQVKKVSLSKATDAQLKSLPGLNSDDLVKKIKGVRPFKQVEDLVARTPGPEPRGAARSSAPR